MNVIPTASINCEAYHKYFNRKIDKKHAPHENYRCFKKRRRRNRDEN